MSASAGPTAAGGLEASRGKHERLPRQESHSPTGGKHDRQMREMSRLMQQGALAV